MITYCKRYAIFAHLRYEKTAMQKRMAVNWCVYEVDHACILAINVLTAITF